MDAQELRAIPLFEGVSDDQLADVAKRFTEVEVDVGTVLARRGDFGYHFFLVKSGMAVVAVDEQLLTTLGPGDSFGGNRRAEAGQAHRQRRRRDRDAPGHDDHLGLQRDQPLGPRGPRAGPRDRRGAARPGLGLAACSNVMRTVSKTAPSG